MAIGLCRLYTAALVGCLIAVPAYAQDPLSRSPAAAPANLAFVDGAVDVVQDGVTDRAEAPLMLLEGDVVRTRHGRAEIVFGDGTLLHLSHDSELEILGADHLRLTGGRSIVRLSHAAARPYVIDTPASSVRLEAEGEYGITADRGARLEVAVTRGAATLTDPAAWTVRGGQLIVLASPGARPRIETFNTARFDAFAQWSADRTHGIATAMSAAQLPYPLRPYAPVLDQYGRWDYLAPHGYVWVPSVGAGWRPYYDGSWSFTRYGWTWRGQERWAWPTHHYGRWGFTGAVWFWTPATLWAPAWVSWSSAPGYVSWAPLGWHGGGAWPRRDHPAYAPNYDLWRGWTVVRRDHFAPRRHVRPHAIDAGRLDDPTRRALITSADAVPRSMPRAVPRNEPRAVTRENPTPVPELRGNVRRPATARPAGASSVGAEDHPAYTPPPARTREDRRGAARDPGARQPRQNDAAVRRDIPREPTPAAPRATPHEPEPAPRAVPRETPRAERPENPGRTERAGAVRRGDGAQGPARGTPPPAADTPPPATPKPATEGGARRRPGPGAGA